MWSRRVVGYGYFECGAFADGVGLQGSGLQGRSANLELFRKSGQAVLERSALRLNIEA